MNAEEIRMKLVPVVGVDVEEGMLALVCNSRTVPQG
jgi:hypothetical protein